MLYPLSYEGTRARGHEGGGLKKTWEKTYPSNWRLTVEHVAGGCFRVGDDRWRVLGCFERAGSAEAGRTDGSVRPRRVRVRVFGVGRGRGS